MDFVGYLRLLRKRMWFVVLLTALGVAAAVVASLATTPVYQAHAELLVVARSQPGAGVDSAYQGALLSQQLVKSFAQMLQSRATAEAALQRNDYPLTASQLQPRIHAEPILDTLLVKLSVEDTEPARARRLTNDVALAFIDSVPRLQGGSTLRVSLVDPALKPVMPVRPRTEFNIAIGLLLGVAVGVGLALLRERLDTTIRSAEPLQAAAEAPVIGAIPYFNATRGPLPVERQPRSAQAEAYRKLRTNFSFLGVDRDGLSCVVTSPMASEGKSTVTANLALALAQAGHRVAVVDGDLRKPTVHKTFRTHQRVGLTSVLLDQAVVEDALQHPGTERLAVLTSGPVPPNPSELLASRRMGDVLMELRQRFDVVLVDCAPALPVTDPMVLSQFVDGVLLVVRARITTRDQVLAVRSACERAGARVLGAVLNATKAAESGQASYYAYYGEKPTMSEVHSLLPQDIEGRSRSRRRRSRSA
jgi:succinoglycan biosynthesis transport protein ExoP